MVGEWLRDPANWEYYRDFLVDEVPLTYVRSVAHGAWGDNITLMAMADMLKLQIEVINWKDPDKNTTITSPRPDWVPEQTIHLVHYFESHYNALIATHQSAHNGV